MLVHTINQTLSMTNCHPSSRFLYLGNRPMQQWRHESWWWSPSLMDVTTWGQNPGVNSRWEQKDGSSLKSVQAPGTKDHRKWSKMSAVLYTSDRYGLHHLLACFRESYRRALTAVIWVVVCTDVADLMNRLAAQGGYDHSDLAHMSG